MGFRDDDAFQAMKHFPRLLKLDQSVADRLHVETNETSGNKIYTIGQLADYYDFTLEENDGQVEYDRFVPGLKREIKAQRPT